MANPQCENGYIKFASELWEALCRIRIPGEARQVFDFIARKTYGYNKKEDAISLSQFVLATGMDKANVCHALSKLKKMNLIAQKGNSIANVYSIIKDYGAWKALPKKTTLPKKAIIVAQKHNQPLPKTPPTIDNNTQKTIIKDIPPISPKVEIEFPEWIPKETWNAYLEMRKTIKKPLKTEAGIKLATNKLQKLKERGYDPKEVLEQSIFNSWQGLFEIRKECMQNRNKQEQLQDKNIEVAKNWFNKKLEKMP